MADKKISKSEDLFEKKEYLNSLYDIYKDLFTPKQRSYFEAYFFDDLSLSEIALNYNVSRNAIFTALKTIETSLEEYENILKIKSKKEQILNVLDEIEVKEEKEKTIKILKEKIIKIL